MYSHIIMLLAGITSSVDRLAPMSECLALCIKTLILGMAIVILSLVLILGIVRYFKLKNAPVVRKELYIKGTDKPVLNDAVNEADDEITAAITAAIIAYRAAEYDNKYTGGFRVVSFRKIKTAQTVRKN